MVNLFCTGFKSTHEIHNTFLGLRVLKSEIIFADENLTTTVVCEGLFSQMRI